MSNKRIQLLGVVLIVAGLILPAVGVKLPSLVAVVVDTSPPEIVDSTPKNGGVYSLLTEVSAYVRDPDSGVSSVQFLIDNIPNVACTLKTGTIYDGVWSAPVQSQIPTTPITLTPGTHSFRLIVVDKATNSKTIEGTFTIYTGLTGDWYINDIKITSPSQEIILKTNTLTFKFVKTGGSAADSSITCKVTYSGPKSGTLSLTKEATASQWSGSLTLPNGKYSMTLEATDGVKTITMSLYNLEVGGSILPPDIWDWLNALREYINILTVLGIILLVYGSLKKR